jgi:hypothetical protein
MKYLKFATLALVSVLSTGAAVRSEVPAAQRLPPGVSATTWIPLGENVGFLIVRESNVEGVPTLEGHTLAWHNGGWKRLDTAGGFRVMPAPGN